MRFLTLLIFCGLAGQAHGWGPHPQITQAALDTLGADHPFKTILGPHANRMPQYCWMADWRTTLPKAGTAQFYADDFLLFPGYPKHEDHLCPHVEKTYAPYFRRAYEAIRMESPENAARWIGAILHFVEDTGSPPHAARVLGSLHTKGENWVKGDLIKIDDYQPALLGEDIDSAVAGLEKRMAGLIAFSKARFERIKPLLEADDRATTEPIVLESALETSRVVADLFHTLGQLAEKFPAKGATLHGKIASPKSHTATYSPAKIMIYGTDGSTLADIEGNFEFRGLPPGKRTLQVERPGCAIFLREIDLRVGVETKVDVQLKEGSLVRNADFSLRWSQPDAPDHWTQRKDIWQSEWIPLEKTTDYRVHIEWRRGGTNTAELIFAPRTQYGAPRITSKPFSPGKPEQTFKGSERFAYAKVVLRGEDDPANSFRVVNFRKLKPVK